jgi:hypothetical protein
MIFVLSLVESYIVTLWLKKDYAVHIGITETQRMVLSIDLG